MNTSFKIFFDKNPNVVIIKDTFISYPNYNDLRKKLISQTVKLSSLVNEKLKEGDNFILRFSEDYKPSGLFAIWNNKTYKYFLDKLTKETNIPKIKFLIQKVDKLPEWKIPQYLEILKKELAEKYEEEKNKIIKDLPQNELKLKKEKYEQDLLLKDEVNKHLLDEKKHINVLCNNCLSINFIDNRYICSECNDFNLCQECFNLRFNINENNLFHDKEHTFIKINKPIYIDINKYKNIFQPNYFYFNNKKDSFEIKFNVINVGESNIEGCFIMSIRYGNKYLGCIRKTITEKGEKNEKQEINMVIKMPSIGEINKSNNILEGYFRMFTEEGLPFGDILYIKVLNN